MLGALRRLPRSVFYVGVASAKTLQALVLLRLIVAWEGPTAYAIWLQVNFGIGLLMPSALLGVDKALIRFAPALRPPDAVKTIRTALVTPLPAMAIAAALVAVLSAPIGDLFFFGEQWPVIVIGVSVIGEGLAACALEGLRGTGREAVFAAVSIGRDIAWIGMSIALLSSGIGFESFVWAYACWTLASGTAAAAAVSRGPYTAAEDPVDRRRLLQFGLPLALAHPAAWAAKYGNAYVLAVIATPVDVAAYGAGAALAGSVVFASAVLMGALVPVLHRTYDRDGPDSAATLAGRAIETTVAYTGTAVAAAVLLGDEALRIVANEEMAVVAGRILPWQLLAVGVLALFGVLSQALHLELRTWRVLVIWSFVGGAQLAFAILLVKRLGVVGAPLAELSALSLGTGALVLTTHHVLRPKLRPSVIFWHVGTCSGAMLAGALLTRHLGAAGGMAGVTALVLVQAAMLRRSASRHSLKQRDDFDYHPMEGTNV